jgi:hypothetical protein
MGRTLSLLALLAASAILPLAAAAPQDGKDDKEPVVREIFLTAGPGWHLRLARDGSGSVGYGASPGDTFAFKAGSIDFKAALKDLHAATNPKGTSRDSYAVAFHEEGKNSAIAVYTRDAKLVLGLFEKALRAEAEVVPGDRVRQLWKELPPPDLSKK